MDTARRRVLVCEDDEAIGALLAAALWDEGYAPAVVRSRAAALAALRRERFAAVLTDCAAPVAHGLDLAALGAVVRAAGPTPVLLSSARLPAAEVDAAALGLAAILPKPFALADLLAAVAAAVRGDEVVWQVGDATPGAPPRRRTVLVVEDDDEVRMLIRLSLAGEALVVRETADGDAALAMARAGGVDLVLLDLVLPDCSGLAVCRALASDPATAAVPVVLLTGVADQASRRLGMEAGAVAYQTKPFSPAALLAAVHRHLPG